MLNITEDDIGSWYIDGMGDYFYLEGFCEEDNSMLCGALILKNTYPPTFLGHNFDIKGISYLARNRVSYTAYNRDGAFNLVRKLDPIEVNLLRLNKYL